MPERATVLLAALAAAGAAVTGARPHADDALLAVHDAELVEHLSTIWAQWEAGGYVSEYGRTRVVPYVFPTPGLLGGLPMRSPAATHGRAGQFCYDTMTLVGPGSWEAIRAAADAALTAADLVAGGRPARLRAVPSARPPRRPGRLRRIVLPEQRGHRGSGAARVRRRAGGGDRHRRAPRQRHAGDLLRPRRRLLRQPARRSGSRLVPALRRLLQRARRRRGHRRQPEPAARAGNR